MSHKITKVFFFTAFTEELCSVFARRSVVTTQEEHHVTHFGHSESGVEIEEVSSNCCVYRLAGVEWCNSGNNKRGRKVVLFNVLRVLVGNMKKKRPFGRLCLSGRIILNGSLRNMTGWRRPNLYDS